MQLLSKSRKPRATPGAFSNARAGMGSGEKSRARVHTAYGFSLEIRDCAPRVIHSVGCDRVPEARYSRLLLHYIEFRATRVVAAVYI